MENGKKKSDVLQRILKRIDEQKNDPNYKPPERKKRSLEYQLGWMIGEYIYFKYLPSLSSDSWRTRNVIEVLPEEEKKLKELTNTWFNEPKKSKEKNNHWIRLREYEIMLDEKYYPSELNCYVPIIENIRDITDLKKGIRDSLWDTDVCSYEINLDDIIIDKSEWNDSIIRLRLDIQKMKNDLYETYGKIK